MSSAKDRIAALTYGQERNHSDDLCNVFDKIADKWQRDKDELSLLREAIIEHRKTIYTGAIPKYSSVDEKLYNALGGAE